MQLISLIDCCIVDRVHSSQRQSEEIWPLQLGRDIVTEFQNMPNLISLHLVLTCTNRTKWAPERMILVSVQQRDFLNIGGKRKVWQGLGEAVGKTSV